MRNTVSKSLWGKAVNYSLTHKETNIKKIYAGLKRIWMATPRNEKKLII